MHGNNNNNNNNKKHFATHPPKKNVIGYESARRNTKFYYCKEKNNDHWSLNTIGNRPKKFDLIFSPDWRARMVCTELEQGLTMQLPLPQETTDLS